MTTRLEFLVMGRVALVAALAALAAGDGSAQQAPGPSPAEVGVGSDAVAEPAFDAAPDPTADGETNGDTGGDGDTGGGPVFSEREIDLLRLLETLDDDEADRGLRLLRRAQRAVAAGDLDEALGLLQLARIELPGSPLVAHTLADLHASRAQWDQALDEYGRGARDGYAFRSAFNSGVVRHAQSEELLREDAVAVLGETYADMPLLPSTLPDGPQPQLVQALGDAIQRHRQARLSFLGALGERSHAGARESVAALNDRLDQLREMLDELEERQQEQDGDQSEDGEQGEQDDEQQDEPQDQDQDQDQDQQDQQQDEGGDDEQQDQDGASDEQDQDDATAPEPKDVAGEPAQLTPQQMAALLDKLEELEEVAMELARRQRENARQGVEKDW